MNTINKYFKLTHYAYLMGIPLILLIIGLFLTGSNNHSWIVTGLLAYTALLSSLIQGTLWGNALLNFDANPPADETDISKALILNMLPCGVLGLIFAVSSFISLNALIIASIQGWQLYYLMRMDVPAEDKVMIEGKIKILMVCIFGMGIVLMKMLFSCH